MIGNEGRGVREIGQGRKDNTIVNAGYMQEVAVEIG